MDTDRGTAVLGPSRRHMSYASTRRDRRYDYPSRIDYVLGSQAEGEVVRRGITIDLSSTGLCMYLLDPLPQGQKITIMTALPVASQAAVICWTRKDENSLYRSGLKFI